MARKAGFCHKTLKLGGYLPPPSKSPPAVISIVPMVCLKHWVKFRIFEPLSHLSVIPGT